MEEAIEKQKKAVSAAIDALFEIIEEHDINRAEFFMSLTATIMANMVRTGDVDPVTLTTFTSETIITSVISVLSNHDDDDTISIH